MDPELNKALRARELGNAVDPVIVRLVDYVLDSRRQWRTPYEDLAREITSWNRVDVSAEELEQFMDRWAATDG